MLLSSNSHQWRDGLAPGQFRMLLAIMELHAKRIPVTYRRLLRRLGLQSPTSVLQNIDKLERLGFVRRTRGHVGSLVPCCTVERIV